MRLFEMVDGREAVMGGGERVIKIASMVGEPITIYGNRAPFGDTPKCEIVAGYALTRGVPKEFFDKWLEQNADHPLVKGNLIFAHESDSSAASMAKENPGPRSGLEPLVRDSRGNMIDARIPKRIQTADEQPKARAEA